jgi:hypothetical protein
MLIAAHWVVISPDLADAGQADRWEWQPQFAPTVLDKSGSGLALSS